MPDDGAAMASYASATEQQLWRAAIKWPMYSVAVMPGLLAAGWLLGSGMPVRLTQLLGFLVAAVLLLLWENSSNDFFDAETGVDSGVKPHSLVTLLGSRSTVGWLSLFALIAGLLLIVVLALRSSPAVIPLILLCCGIGYAYQGPPLRLGYLGLGEPLCWLAFGPLATAAALLVLSYPEYQAAIPWENAVILGAGPALATTLVLFCSHFHQADADAVHGKQSPIVRLGTTQAAALVPWFVATILGLEWLPVICGNWPTTSLLGGLGLPAASSLICLLRCHHNQPDRVSGSKFLALRFQTLNGLGLALGLALKASAINAGPG